MDTDVLIVGAGLSGLIAARCLRAAGRSVRVVEAHARPGGRVQTLQDPAWGSIDLGAQWVSGRHRRMLALIRHLGLRTVPSPTEGSVTVLRRGRLRHGGAMTGLGLRGVAQVAWRFLRFQAGLVPRDPTVTVAAWLGSGPGAAHLRAQVEEGFCLDASEVSMVELVDQLRSVGGLRALASAEDLLLPEGTGALAAFLAAGVGDDLWLDWPVQCIDREDGGFTVTGRAGCARGRRLLLALPPESALRIPGPHHEAYVPHRPGRVVKAHLRYDRPWWRERGWSGMARMDDGPVAFTADRGEGPGGCGILVALCTGPHADRLRAVQAAERPSAIAAAIDRALPGGPPPRAVHLQDWGADPWIPGGYASHPWPGTAPWRPRPPAGIAIAGTEASPVWRSYMEGALAAGEAAAQRLLAER